MTIGCLEGVVMGGRHGAGGAPRRVGRHGAIGAGRARHTPVRLVASLACGGFAYWVYARVAWAYLLSMTRGALESDPVLGVGMAVAVVSVAVAVCYWDLGVFGSGVPKSAGDAQAVVYCVLLAGAVMGKSVGVRGVNWDVAAIVDELVPLSPTLVLNVLLFVPVGMMLTDALRESPWAHVGVAAVLLSAEALQYALSLGVCDVNDVLVNYCGVLCGVAAASWLRAHVCVLRCDGGRYVVRRVVRA